eukprot:968875-Lingulodinium_polyedra.AAC.1
MCVARFHCQPDRFSAPGCCDVYARRGGGPRVGGDGHARVRPAHASGGAKVDEESPGWRTRRRAAPIGGGRSGC